MLPYKKASINIPHIDLNHIQNIYFASGRMTFTSPKVYK